MTVGGVRKCAKHGCYTRIEARRIACDLHAGLISAVTLGRIRETAQRRDWAANSVALPRAVDELNGSPRPLAIDDETLDQLIKEGVL